MFCPVPLLKKKMIIMMMIYDDDDDDDVEDKDDELWYIHVLLTIFFSTNRPSFRYNKISSPYLKRWSPDFKYILRTII